MTNVIELTQVGKVYNGPAAQAALEDVTLSVASGELAAVMGPSGSGKSTLLNLIAGLDRPTAGMVRVCGQDLGGMSESGLARFRRSQIGIVFQFFHLLNDLSVLDNILIPAELAGIKRWEARRRAEELLAQLRIADKGDAYPAELSGGQRQRVAIARAIVNQPPLLLADEPTGALDSRSGDEIMGLLDALNEAGQTIILVTHDAKLAARSARRIVTLRDGRITDDTTLAASPELAAGKLVSFAAEKVQR